MPPDTFAGHPDRKIVEAVAVEIAHGDGAPEAVAVGGAARHRSGLAELAGSSGVEPVCAAHDDRHRTGDRGPLGSFADRTDGHVAEAVIVEVAAGDVPAERVVDPEPSREAPAALHEALRSAPIETTWPAGYEVHHACPGDPTHAFAR